MTFRIGAEAWRARIRTFNAQDYPEDFLVAWVDKESGGNAAALGANTEVGIMQIDLQDGPKFGGTMETLHTNFAPYGSQKAFRALSDAEKDLQVTCALKMVDWCVARARSHTANVGADWPEGSSDFWKLVKWQHALPAYSLPLLQLYKSTTGSAPSSFDAWADWVNALGTRPSFVAAKYWNGEGGTGLSHYFANAQEVGTYGGVERVPTQFLALALVLLLLYFVR